jgi:hypothetical protein
MSQSENPYAEEYNPFQAPENPFDPAGLGGTHAEAIRNAHLSHEASVKSVGALYMIGGVLCLAVSGLFLFIPNGPGAEIDGMFILLPVIGIIQFATAFGLRGLQGWARIPTGLFSALGLLGFPIGTIINGYILYLIFSAKGSMVFSQDYREIIAQTPHIKYRTSIIVKIFLFLLLALLTFGVVAVVMGA